MKFNFTKPILLFLLISSSMCISNLKTETQSCWPYVVYNPYSIVSSPTSTVTYSYPATTADVVYTTPVDTYPYTTTYSTYYTPVFGYQYQWYVMKKQENLNLSVIHDKDLKSYDVKGNLFHRDEANKESWFVQGKVDSRVNTEALKSCLQVHNDLRKKNFRNVDKAKYTKNVPEFLIPKKDVFNRAPTIKVDSKQKLNEDENKVEIKKEKKTTTVNQVAAPKARAEESVKTEKKVDKKVEEKKPVEKKEEKKVEKKAEFKAEVNKPVENLKKTDTKAKAEVKVEAKVDKVEKEIEKDVKKYYFIQKAETAACSQWGYYYPYYYTNAMPTSTITYSPVTPVVYSSYSPTVVEADTPYTFYNIPVSTYEYYYYTMKKKEKLNLTVIHDHDLKSYDVKGALFHRDETNKENWYILGKFDAKVSEALKSCKQIHDDLRKGNFKNVDKSKVTKNVPEFLVPKKEVFNKKPTIKTEKVAEKKEKKVEVKKVEEKKVEEKKVEEKKVEEKKVEEKKEEAKQDKPVEKKKADAKVEVKK